MSTVPTNLINVDLFPAQEAMLEQMQVDYNQQAFQESTGAEILNTGLMGHIWADNIHVSSVMSEQGLMEQHGMAQEQELIEYLGAAVQDTINSFDPGNASHAAAMSNMDPLPSMADLASVQPIGEQMADMGYVMAPMFEIASNPTIRLDEIKARRFIIFDPLESSYLFDNIENRFNLMDFS